jgi:hypothetical protein
MPLRAGEEVIQRQGIKRQKIKAQIYQYQD